MIGRSIASATSITSMSSEHKYHAKKTVVDGHRFDSKKEANRYIELCLMERAKAIQDLKMQVAFPLIKKSQYGREIKYVADFTYFEEGKLVVEDTKSPATRTPLYRLKKRLMAEIYGIVIRET